MSFLAELWAVLRVGKTYRRLPIMIMTAVFGGLVASAQGSAVAPFVDTVF